MERDLTDLQEDNSKLSNNAPKNKDMHLNETAKII